MLASTNRTFENEWTDISAFGKKICYLVEATNTMFTFIYSSRQIVSSSLIKKFNKDSFLSKKRRPFLKLCFNDSLLWHSVISSYNMGNKTPLIYQAGLHAKLLHLLKSTLKIFLPKLNYRYKNRARKTNIDNFQLLCNQLMCVILHYE